MKKNLWGQIKRGIVFLILLLVVILFKKVNYCSNLMYIAIIAYAVTSFYMLFLLEHRHKRLLLLITFLFTNVLCAICSDGLLFGNRISYKSVLMRGAVRTILDKRIIPNDAIYKAIYGKAEYDENGYRISKKSSTSDYTYEKINLDCVRLERITPTTPNNRIVLALHGGAYVGEMSDLFVDEMKYYSKMDGGATVVALDYKTAPTYHYSDILSEIMITYKWILSQGYKEEDIVIAGDSAGGGLAIATCVYLRDCGMKMPKAIVTLSAWTNLAFETESYQKNRKVDCYFGANDTLKMAAEDYIGESDPKNPYISPYYADLHGLPPMLMQVGSYELLYNDSVDFAKRAEEQGVDVTLQIYPGMFHVFQIYKGFLPEANQAWEAMEAYLDEIYK